jgi:hypothetical protein
MRHAIFFPIALAALLVPATSAPQSAPDAGNDAAAPPSDAGPAVPAKTGPERFFIGPPPDEKSRPPKVTEWDAEQDITLARGASSCTARRVREWMRVRCEVTGTQYVALVTGTKTDVYSSIVTGVTCWGDGDDYRCSDRVEILFPLRRGDRRVFQIVQRLGYAMPLWDTSRASHVISETWLEDDPAPIVTVSETL